MQTRLNQSLALGGSADRDLVQRRFFQVRAYGDSSLENEEDPSQLKGKAKGEKRKGGKPTNSWSCREFWAEVSLMARLGRKGVREKVWLLGRRNFFSRAL